MELTKREDRKQQNQVDPAYGLLNFDYNYDFPSVKKLLVIGFVSHIWFTEAEKATLELEDWENRFTVQWKNNRRAI